MTFFILALLAVLILLVIFWYWKRPNWMGFTELTLWDWIKAMSLPVTLAFTAGGLGYVQSQAQDNRIREESLQVFIDRISALSLNGLENDNAVAVARAHSNAVLRLVYKERAGRALAFLGEMNLLQTLLPTLEHVDLVGAELKNLNLRGMDFEGSDLRKAELENADLRGVDFEGSDLRGTDFKDADMRGSNFAGANVKGADFDHADLRGADLGEVIGAKSSQLLVACLDEETIVPPPFAIKAGESTGCEGSAEND